MLSLSAPLAFVLQLSLTACIINNGQSKLEISQNYANVKVQTHSNTDNLKQLYEENQQATSEKPEIYKFYAPNQRQNLQEASGVESTTGNAPGKFWQLNNEPPNRNLQNFEILTTRKPKGFYVTRKRRNYQINVNSNVLEKCPDGATGQFAYQGSCALFLNCWKGRGVVQNCPPGTLFNGKECDFAQKVQCLNAQFRSFDAGQNLKGRKQAQCPKGFSGIIPHYGDCRKFLQCDFGRQFSMDCPPGTLFDQTSNLCDFEHKVRCDSNAGNPSELKTGYQNLNFVSSAGQNLYFNQMKQQPYENRNFANVGRENFNPNEIKIKENNKPKVVVQIQNPQNYFQSSTKAYHLQPNPQNGIFGPNIQYSADFQSSHGTGQNYTFRSSRIEASDRCPQGHTGLLPHSKCSKFLNCAQGRTFAQDCAPGTLFNPEKLICDFPYKVKCGQNLNANQDLVTAATVNRYNQIGGNFGGSNQFYSNFESTQRSYQSPINRFNNYETTQRTYQGDINRFGNFETTPRSYLVDPNNGRFDNFETTERTYPTIVFEKPPFVPQNYPVNYQSLPNSKPSQTSPPIQNANFAAPVNSYKSKPWPPPFPSTDTNADYILETEEDYSEDTLEEPTDWCRHQGFECGNKICINPSLVCDDSEDCPYGRDEQKCNLYIRNFLVNSDSKLAIKEVKRIVNITVKHCAKICSLNSCKAFNYRKFDKACFILDKNLGDTGALMKLPMHEYYEHSRYTKACGGFLCPNLKCIDYKQKCDGINDCRDGFDEKLCPAEKLQYNLTLIDGDGPNSGNLLVTALGKTGYICDDIFNIKNADVACKELGYHLGAVEVKPHSFYPPSKNLSYLMDDVSCMGTESSLRDCDFSGWAEHNCDPQEIVGVICKSDTKMEDPCPKDHWGCRNALECLPLAFLCDGVYDCSDRSDEDTVQCDSAIGIRLSGINGTKGRLEVQYHGIWGTVCDDDFNDDAAKVVCRQLGFDGHSAKVVKGGLFGPGKGPIWLDQVFCHGNESLLQDCLHWDWGEHNCEHAEDVGVVCQDQNSQGGQSPRNLNLKPEVEDPKLPEECGLTSDTLQKDSDEFGEVHFRAVNSAVARKGDYPWQASIRVSSRTKSAHWCGAIVLSSKFILTAAHCLRGFSKGAYFVVAGDYNLDTEEGTEQTAQIEDFIIHENFGQGNKMNNDIALIKLKSPGFELNQHIKALCLPDEELEPNETNCTISGFGSIESGISRASKNLRAGWLPILPQEVCTMPHVYGDAITSGMLCAGFLEKGSVDACEGDSGGPLACLHDGLFKLYGITSWGQHCGHANKPGVYVNVVKYRKWIDETMSKLSRT